MGVEKTRKEGMNNFCDARTRQREQIVETWTLTDVATVLSETGETTRDMSESNDVSHGG